MNLLQPMLIATLLTTGFGVALLGSIKLPLANRLQVDEARVGRLVSLFGFTLIPITLAAGFVTDLVGRQVVLVAGCVLLVASIGILAAARRYAAALLAVILLSAGWSLMCNVGNVLMPLAFPGAPAYSTNLANVFFGLGAFLTPLVVTLLMRRTTLGGMLALLAVVCTLPAALAIGMNPANLVPAAENKVVEELPISLLFGNPIMSLCGIAMLFYAPLEASIGAWATTYLGEQGCREHTSAGLLSAFWLTFMASRLVTAFTLAPGQESALMVVASAASAGILGAMVLVRSKSLASLLVVAAGAAFGPIFPTLLAILLSNVEEPLQGRAVGLLFCVGGFGWTLIPMEIGKAARKYGVRRAFAIAVVAAVALTAASAGLLRQLNS